MSTNRGAAWRKIISIFNQAVKEKSVSRLKQIRPVRSVRCGRLGLRGERSCRKRKWEIPQL